MTFGDRESIDDDILAALRADARTAVPRASRHRVLRRLGVSASVLGAATTVSTGAGALVAGAVASHSTALLVSTLALGIGIGFGARSGLEVFRDPGATSARRVPVAAPARAMAPSRPGPPSRAAETPLLPVPVPPLTASTATVEPPSDRRPARSEAARPESVSSVATPVLAPPSLAAQQALLDDARSALVRHDGTSALSAIGAHRLRFPDTALGEERAALEIRALLELGRTAEARERHASFRQAFPGSLFAPSLEKLLPSPAADSMTEPPAGPQ